MGATLDIDVGGTFTDCYGTFNGKIAAAKVETTEYDPSVGFVEVIKKCVEQFDVSLQEFLDQTERIQYSTTLALNSLIARKGPKIGLITTEGFEDIIHIGRGSQWQDGKPSYQTRNLARIAKPEPLISRDMVVGLKERVDSFGRAIRPLDEEDALKKIQVLVDKGAKGFAVSLLWSFLNPAHEKRIKEIIEREYPASYLGSMPIFLSCEVMPKKCEYPRAMATVLNAYLHKQLADALFAMGLDLREKGYRKPLVLVNNGGGTAEVFKTTAIETFNGGPVAGLIGSSYLARQYGYQNVISADVGGTSFDIGLIVKGDTSFSEFRPTIDTWEVGTKILEINSIGAGGGSIAWINHQVGGRLEVGPMSAGSNPGPAAYDQGGQEPTVTDADVVLGYISPDYFHGGAKSLNVRKARRSIQRIADFYGLSIEEAALRIKRLADAKMGDEIKSQIGRRGFDPHDFILFAYGGAGATHAAGFGEHVGVDQIVIFPFSGVFSAFGSSNMDVLHTYQKSRHILLINPTNGEYLRDFDEFNSVVKELQAVAIRDLCDEGFAEDQIEFMLELDMRYGGQLHVKRVTAPSTLLESYDDVKLLYNVFEEEYSAVYSRLSADPRTGVDIDNFVLNALVKRPKFALSTAELSREVEVRAKKGERQAYWESGFQSTPVYELSLLKPGNRIEGPLICEDTQTTVVVPPGRYLYVNEFGHYVLRKDG